MGSIIDESKLRLWISLVLFMLLSCTCDTDTPQEMTFQQLLSDSLDDTKWDTIYKEKPTSDSEFQDNSFIDIGEAGVCIWSSRPDSYPLKVKLDTLPERVLSFYHTRTPVCGDPGTLSYAVCEGFHTIHVRGKHKTWDTLLYVQKGTEVVYGIK